MGRGTNVVHPVGTNIPVRLPYLTQPDVVLHHQKGPVVSMTTQHVIDMTNHPKLVNPNAGNGSDSPQPTCYSLTAGTMSDQVFGVSSPVNEGNGNYPIPFVEHVPLDGASGLYYFH